MDFLNTLTQPQATARKADESTDRYAITGTEVGSYATTKPYVALNFMGWVDSSAYAAWSGLRPFTELEYEKACRGPLAPVADEYTWGTTGIAQAEGISNENLVNETAANAEANAVCLNDTAGPLRVGCFATATSTRVAAGASYWGIMELSGNVTDRPVSVGNANGRLFTGLHGDGVLTSAGAALVTNWPASGTASGAGCRGGDWRGGTAKLCVSDRSDAAETNTFGNYNFGFRAARSAPPGE